MDSLWIQNLLQWIADHPGWSGAVIFLIAFIESFALAGLLIPGIFILFGVGALIGLQTLDFVSVWIWASAGAVLGDGISFWLGHRYGKSLLGMWPFRSYPEVIAQGRTFIRRHGMKSILLGRFLGPLRPVVPVTAGILGMRTGRFLKVDLPACIAWAPAYLLPGLLFGASLEVVSEYSGRMSLFIALLVAAVWLTLWSGRMIYELIAARSARILRHAIRWSRRHHLLGKVTGPLLDPTRPEVLSIAMLWAALFITFWAMITLLLLLPYDGTPLKVDQYFFDLALRVRNDVTDPPMIMISQLGSWRVVLPGAAIVAIVLLFQRRWKAAAHWALAVAGGSLLQIFLIEAFQALPAFVKAPRPDQHLPSAELVLASSCIGFFAVMVSPDMERIHRRWPYLVGVGAILLLAVSRLYLGLDVFSTVMGGFLLGSCWVLVVGIAYRQRCHRHGGAFAVSILFYAVLAVAMTWAGRHELRSAVAEYAIPLELHHTTADRWWEGGWRDLPARRARFGSPAAQVFNLQLSGSRMDLDRILARSGWEPAAEADWRWPLQALNPGADAETLPIPGRNYLGYSETLHLVKSNSSNDAVQSLRLWDSGWRLGESGGPLLVGHVITEVVRRRLRLFSYWEARPPETDQLEALAELLRNGGCSVRFEDGLMLVSCPVNNYAFSKARSGELQGARAPDWHR